MSRSELKTQLILLDVSTNHSVGLPRSLHFKFCQMIYLFKTFIMLWGIFSYAAGYLVMTLVKISPKLALFLKFDILQNFLKYYWTM